MLEYGEDHYTYDVKEIIQELRQEIFGMNHPMYSSFLPQNVDMDKQLELFEENKFYNQEICDTFLLALCNRFNIEVVVVERTESGVDEIKHIVEPNCTTEESFPQRIFYLLRKFDHYDPLLSHGMTFVYLYAEDCRVFSGIKQIQ